MCGYSSGPGFDAHRHFTLICPNSQLTPPWEIRLQPQAALPAETPIHTSAVRHDAGEMPTDAFGEDRLPRDEAEAEAIVAAQGFEHSKASAGEIGRAD
jgi:hypothetical protein